MDYYSDSGALFAKLFSKATLPVFMSDAFTEDDQSLGKLASTAFADPVNRLFPIHDPSHVYISAAYAYAQGQESVIPQIEKTAGLFGIGAEIQELKKTITERLSKEASQKTAADASEKEFRVPIGAFTVRGTNEMHLKEAFFFFEKELPSLSFDERTIAAQGLCKEAEERQVEIPVELEIYAGRLECVATKVASALETRRTLFVSREDKEKVASLLSWKAEESNPDTWLKGAKILDTFDRENGLDRYYGERLQDAHHTIFNTVKVANTFPDSISIGKKVYGRDRYVGNNFDMFHTLLEAALGKTAADGLFADKQPVQAKFAELDEKQQELAVRFLG